MSRALLYLDQAYYTALLGAENEQLATKLRAEVSAGRLVCPVSMFHFIETAKTRDHGLRRRLVGLMTELSDGMCLRSLDQVWCLERDAFRSGMGRDWVCSRLLARDPLADSLQLLTTAEVDPRVVKQLVDSPLRRDAVAANQAAPVAWTAERDSLARAVALEAAEVPATREAFMSMFPSQAVRFALDEATLRARKHGVEPNDLVDFLFVANVFAYFDALTVDRRTGARLADAERAGTLPATSCVVVRRFSELERVVDRILAAALDQQGRRRDPEGQAVS